MSDEVFALRLARSVRDEVLPMFGTPAARERTGTAEGGDPTYAIDAHGERVVRDLFAGVEDAAYFTEDEGLVVRGRPRTLFLVDPVDGTRPSTAGFETCVVAVALAPFGDGVTVGDVTYGCIVEIATGATFESWKGNGARADGRALSPADKRDLRGLFWAGGFRGQPAVLTATVLADLFDEPGAEGAFFDQGSAAYSLTRVATGQLDAFVDVGRTIVEEVPGAAEEFLRIGEGSILNTTTYDTAAGLLLLRELGCPVSDGLGRPLEDLPLLDAGGRAETVATVAACTPELHERLLGAVASGLRRLK